MKISRIDHLGIGVKSIEEALPFFENVLGLKCYAVEEVADQKVKTAFLKVGEVKLELLEPTSPESAVAKWLENGGKGVHHVAFAVEDSLLKMVFRKLSLSVSQRKYVLSTRLHVQVQRI